jgi:hypothetical protein
MAKRLAEQAMVPEPFRGSATRSGTEVATGKCSTAGGSLQHTFSQILTQRVGFGLELFEHIYRLSLSRKVRDASWSADIRPHLRKSYVIPVHRN